MYSVIKLTTTTTTTTTITTTTPTITTTTTTITTTTITITTTITTTTIIITTTTTTTTTKNQYVLHMSARIPASYSSHTQGKLYLQRILKHNQVKQRIISKFIYSVILASTYRPCIVYLQ